jgi:predicted O-methyltransferase YrrM
MTAKRNSIVSTVWNGKEPFDGAGPQGPADFQGWASDHSYLKEAIQERRPSVVIEVGVWKGGSVLTMAEEMRRQELDSVIVAVDTWLGAWDHWLQPKWFEHLRFSGGYPTLYYTFASNVVSKGLQEFIVPLPLDSVNAAVILKHYNIDIDVIHLDGGHDFACVMADLRVWWPLLKPGGLLIGDDYHETGNVWPDVRRAFQTFFGSADIENVGGKCRLTKEISTSASQIVRTGKPRIIH